MVAPVIDRWGTQLAIALGDYHRALGVSLDARKLDIDVAAANLSRRYPRDASRLSAVARVLTHSDTKRVYESLVRLRDSAIRNLTDRCGPEFLRCVPNSRQELWRRCCGLLQFDLDNTSLLVGPKGAESLASQGERWVVEMLLDACLAVVHLTEREIGAGAAVRELWEADCPNCGHSRPVFCCRIAAERESSSNENDSCSNDEILSSSDFEPQNYGYRLPRCANCHSRLESPSEYDGTYTFVLPPGRRWGSVVQRPAYERWRHGFCYLGARRTITAV